MRVVLEADSKRSLKFSQLWHSRPPGAATTRAIHNEDALLSKHGALFVCCLIILGRPRSYSSLYALCNVLFTYTCPACTHACIRLR